MAINFSTTREIAQINGIKILVYGKAGVGKTKLCSTLPNLLLISCESGLLSLRNFDIPVLEIKTIEDLEEAFKWVSSNKAAKKFETISLDSLTDIAEVVLAKAKANVKDPRQAYGELVERMLKVIKDFRDLKGKNVYFTAKEARIKDDKTGMVTIEPSMPGAQLGPGLAYYFDEVFRMDIGEDASGKKVRYLQTDRTFQVDAKDRSGVLAEKEPANLQHIFDKIIGVTK